MANVSSSNSQGANVPKLRFPEFEGEWEVKSMEEIFTEIIEKNHPELPVLSILQGSGTVLRDSSDRRITYDKTNLSSYKTMEIGDFIIHLRSFEGGLECSNHHGISSPAYKILRTTCLIPEAYMDYFRSYMFIHGKLSVAVTGIRDGKSIDMPSFWGIKIAIPTINEQRKIASFLMLLKKRMKKQQQLVELLKSYKRGALSRLFPKNGSSVPEYRFAGFTGKWKQRKLGEVSRRNIVGLATSVTPYYRTEGVPILRNLNIKENYLDNADILFLERDYAESQINKQIHTGDVLTVHTGYIGTSCVVPEKYDNCLTFTTLITTTNPSILLGEFLSQYLNSDIGMNAVQAVTTQGGRQNLNTNDFVKVKISFPEIREQKKICAALSQLDTLITLHQKKFEQYIDLKRSMLEKLFI